MVDNGYKNLRDFMDNGNYTVTEGADQACGWTDPNGISQQIPENGTMRTSGYTHDGPCEIYMGDKLTLSYLNCRESITEQPYKLDYSDCGDSCILYWYWLGVRFVIGISWQVYKECIPIYSALSGASSSNTTTEAPTTHSPSVGLAVAIEADSTSGLTPGSSYETLTTESTGEGPTTKSSLASEPTQTEAPSTGTPTAVQKCSVARERVRV
ncbi:hypothetical protein ON010_g774 [Phytophthora cinnamomi]|nr:hypothetical protein ON010_g774 [Phytophthora cinnamomi]